MSRKPRKCIFCGATANSKEHIWPTWLHDALGPAEPGARHDKQTYSFNPRDGLEVSGPKGRQGDQRTIRVRAVCTTCNNGWMNKIEGEVRGCLEPIVRGEKKTLSLEQIEVLAKWLSLKVMVIEHDGPDISLTPQVDRTAFCERGVIPSYFRLYCAHNISGEPLFLVRHSHTIASNAKGPTPALEGTARNIQVITMVVGEAVLQAVCTRLNAFALEDKTIVNGFHDRCRFWPDPPDKIEFPARPRLDAKGVHYVANFFERYIQVAQPYWVV